jgi:hypothetical protein
MVEAYTHQAVPTEDFYMGNEHKLSMIWCDAYATFSRHYASSFDTYTCGGIRVQETIYRCELDKTVLIYYNEIRIPMGTECKRG